MMHFYNQEGQIASGSDRIGDPAYGWTKLIKLAKEKAMDNADSYSKQANEHSFQPVTTLASRVVNMSEQCTLVFLYGLAAEAFHSHASKIRFLRPTKRTLSLRGRVI
jgi:hypothetical protein